MIPASLAQLLKQLRLSGLADALLVRLQEAAGHALSHVEFLELILNDEWHVRQQRAIGRRMKQAQFRETKTLEDFDFSFNPSMPKRRVYDLATGGFLHDATDVLWIGPPGTGKSHVCQALGYTLIKSGFTVLYRSIFDVVRDFLHEAAFDVDSRVLKPDLLIVDDMGMKELPRKSGECLFEIILRRHQVKSTMMTSNRPLEDWGKLIGDVPAATAILDRFLETAELIQLEGRSYRLRNRSSKEKSRDEKSAKTGQSAHRVEPPKTDVKTNSKKSPTTRKTSPDSSEKK